MTTHSSRSLRTTPLFAFVVALAAGCNAAPTDANGKGGGSGEAGSSASMGGQAGGAGVAGAGGNADAGAAGQAGAAQAGAAGQGGAGAQAGAAGQAGKAGTGGSAGQAGAAGAGGQVSGGAGGQVSGGAGGQVSGGAGGQVAGGAAGQAGSAMAGAGGQSGGAGGASGAAGQAGGGQAGSGGSSGADPGCPAFAPGDPTQHQFGGATATPIISADQTWKTDHVYFVLSTFEVRGATLTIEAGARVCLSQGGAATPTIFVAETGATKGRVVINGTAERPVIFDSATPLDVYSGFAFNGNSEAHFDHVVFKNAGFGGGGVLRFAQANPGAAVLRDVHLVDFHHLGLSLQSPAGLSADSTVFIESQDPNTTQPIVRAAVAAMPTLTPATLKITPTITDDRRALAFADAEISADLTLSGTIGAAYLVESGDLVVRQGDPGSPVPTLTVDAGARLRFGDGSLVIGDVGSDNVGNLAVNGTASSPVVFSGVTAGQGTWNGITVHFDGLGTTVLRDVRIEDAGGVTGTNILNCRSASPLQAAVRLRPAIVGPYAGPTIERLEVVRSGGDGIAFGCGMNGCLTTDYASVVSGSDNVGVLVRPLGCL